MTVGASAPNILLINCDDLGYGDLGCYGSVRNETPVLDRLAAEGMRLTDFSMASPVCSPSRAAMLTGCYPTRVGFGEFEGLPVLFPGQRLGLSTDETTLARVLQDAGYATAAIGKWHCGDQHEFLPTRHGFDSYYGIPYSNDMGRQAWPEGLPSQVELMAMFGMKLPVEEFPPLPLLHDDEVLEEQPDQTSLTARFVEQSVRFLRANADRPWFLYLAHIYVHVPLYVPQRFLDASTNGRYGGAVAAIDWAAGVLLAELVRLGLSDNTIVIFTSDNGSRARDEGGSNDPLRGEKGTTWEGGMRVPGIIRWPGHVPAGVVNNELTSSLDLLPTLAAFAGADLPDDRALDGLDIGGVLTGTAPSPRQTLAHYSGNNLNAVRTGSWKLHLARDGKEVSELYDLDADLAETTNVYSEHPDLVRELTALADVFRADLGDARLGIEGAGRRPVGSVENPVTLTAYRPDHPYFIAEYDLTERG